MLYYYSLQSRLGTITLFQAGEALIRLILSPQDADLVKDPNLSPGISPGRSWKSGAPT